MKIPKTVIIAGRTWKVKKHPKDRGGWFYSDKGEIHIGIAHYTKEEIMQNFLHEVLEAILANEMFRYKLPYNSDDNGLYIFVFKHLGLERVVRELYLALREVRLK